MKTKIIITLLVMIASTKVYSQDSIHFITGPHGGLLKTIENYKIETINTYGCITAYLYDGTLKVIPNKFISGSIIFFHNNAASINNYLIPMGTDGFTVDVSNTDYIYYMIKFKVNGNFITARYDNLYGITEKKK